MRSLFNFVFRGKNARSVRRSRLGAALVVILCAVVLVTVMALAFMASVTIERQASTSYASGVEVRMLAESAVNLVMGQIRDASEQNGVVWTSQPGLLRTFRADGTPDKIYKLYSSQAISASASSFNPSNDLPGDWASRPADYVDLNRAAVSRIAGIVATNYPIVDPRGVGKVEGFSTNSSDGVAMPVAWLYVLQDGTITNATGMTKTNPPVARVAFWTDDETCKLNINTASEGVYWEIPHGNNANLTPDEYRMATNQPAQREYQAYPGHPATTSLSPALWSYFKSVNSTLTRTNSSSTTNTFPEILYSMLPRTTGGGSRGGTVIVDEFNGSLPFKTDRFFSSVDEMAFLSPPTNSTSRQTNAYFSRDVIEQTRFFLTAHSRAPELNLFNLPRVTIWPVHAQTGTLYRTPYDNLIAFASTMNSNAYYFTRADANSPTVDLSPDTAARNVQLYGYLQTLTGQAVPGFGGGNFAGKYGADRDQILTEVFDYIRCIDLFDTSSGVTNFQTFTKNAYSNNAVWIGHHAMEPQPGVGQVIPIAPVTGPASGTRGFGRFQTLSRALLVLCALRNEINTNTTPPQTNTVTQAALFFDTFSPSQGHVVFSPNYDINVTTARPFTVRSSEGTNGSASITNTFSFSGVNHVQTYGQDVLNKGGAGGYDGFVANTLFLRGDPGRTKWPTNSDATLFTDRPLLCYPYITAPFTNTWNSGDPTVELSGGKITAELRTTNGVTVQKIDFNFPGTIVVPMPKWDANGTNSGLQPAVGSVSDINGFKGRFLQARVPCYYPRGVAAIAANQRSMDGIYVDNWVTTNDVARSLEPTGVQGDLRLLALHGNDDATFQKTVGYTLPDPRQFSALLTTRGSALYLPGSVSGFQGFGHLVKDGTTNASVLNYLPSDINGVTNADGAPGDWDAGIGSYPSGPFINKSDDGNIMRRNLAGTYGTYIPYILNDTLAMPPGVTFSSPSRQVPSPVMFGSLPTGVKATPTRPWQTLLFCPNPASRYGAPASAHPGELSPKDHLLLDLFHIPVVEPYAISEPFSTAGKVNLNYHIIPFTSIERKTGIYGVLQAVKIRAVSEVPFNAFRYPIQIRETLKYLDRRFATNGIFLSSSEICDIPLIPDPSNPGVPAYPWTTPVTTNNIDAFWATNRFTGDNLREQPYALIYPRLTTRSNIYTVHVWVETLKKIPSTPSGEWVEGRDKVTGEFRGSFLIERYINPADPDIPDATTVAASTENFNRFYRYRVISSTQFNP